MCKVEDSPKEISETEHSQNLKKKLNKKKNNKNEDLEKLSSAEALRKALPSVMKENIKLHSCFRSLKKMSVRPSTVKRQLNIKKVKRDLLREGSRQK